MLTTAAELAGWFSCSQERARVSEEVASEDCAIAELFLNSQNLVILGEAVRAARSAGLNLTCAEAADEVTNEVVLSLARTVRNHDAPACSLRHVACLDRLGHGTNLVDLEEESIAKFLVDACLDALGVGD